MIPRFSKSCKNPGNSLYTKWNLLIKIFKEMKLLKPLTYNICSVVRNNDIYIVLFMSKCKAKIFSLDFIPLLGNGAAFCPLKKSRKSKYCTSWKLWDHLSPLLPWLNKLYFVLAVWHATLSTLYFTFVVLTKYWNWPIIT